MITSVKNPAIKLLRSLKTKKGRRETGLCLIEGERLVFDAAASGAVFDTALVSSERPDLRERLDNAGIACIEAPETVLRAVCDTETPQGVCAAVRANETEPPEEYPHGLVVALDTVQDPGNLGTVLRTADAFGAAGVLVGLGGADPYSAKALRAAMGSTFHLPVWQGELQPELIKLKNAGYSLVCGHLEGAETLPEMGDDRVLIIGNEANGVSDETAGIAYRYRLPMKGRAESLNAAAAAAILIYKLSE
ncbi:MAG: RNA methyltransferase [Clostridiales bacterium]|nr:RNA methyltransferase [Clostridiales bacterium]